MPAPPKHVDYNQIARNYDNRYKINRLDGVESALLRLASKKSAVRVLEVGCGTGHWLSAITTVAHQVFGLDLSSGMLHQAQKQSQDLHLTCGYAGKLPFRNQSFDVVFCVNALHHFEDPRGFITEGMFLLKPGGCMAIIGQVPQDRRNRWFVYDYFAGTYETDLKRFHTWETVRGWMAEDGLEDIKLESVEHLIDHKFGREVLSDPFLKKQAVSQLALLSDQEYERGIQKIQEALAGAEPYGKILSFQVELRLDMLVGNKKA
jgi:ubiquinone/menaquinone biosynthesis C-methylase UbiE